VPFQVIDGHKRLGRRQPECLAVRDADEERPNQSGATSYGDSVEVSESHLRLAERFPHDRHDLPQVFARCQLGDDAAILAVNFLLRRHHA